MLVAMRPNSYKAQCRERFQLIQADQRSIWWDKRLGAKQELFAQDADAALSAKAARGCRTIVF